MFRTPALHYHRSSVKRQEEHREERATVSLEVKSVRNRWGLDEFIAFPKQLYKWSSAWVPMFDIDYRRFFRKKHPFFQHAETEFLIVWLDDEPAARVMMIH